MWHELWTGFIEPKNIVWWITLRRGVGGVQGTEKLHSSECFHYFFPFFFFRTLSHCSLFSIYDVDFIIWFLKRWYFFRKKIKPLWMSFCCWISELVTYPCSHLEDNSACIKYSAPLGPFHVLLFYNVEPKWM